MTMLTSPAAHWLAALAFIITGGVWLLGYAIGDPPLRKLAAVAFGGMIALATIQILAALFPSTMQEPISQLWPR
jgi:type IV secretory pathway VirB2 component (pilin)